MSLIDIEIQSQNNFTDSNSSNYEQMNFLLAKDDYIETRCGEIFMSHCKILIFSCSECKENFSSYEEFFNHLCEQHVSIDDELKYEPDNEDLLDVEYYDEKVMVVVGKGQEDNVDVKRTMRRNSPKNTLVKDVLSQDVDSQDVDSQDVNSQDVHSQDVNSQDVNSQDVHTEDVNSQDVLSQDEISQGYEISQYDDEFSQDIIEHYGEIEEFEASQLVESAEEKKTVTFLNDFSKFLEKDYRDVVDCELPENDSADYMQSNADPFELDYMVDDGGFDCSRCDKTFDSQFKLRAHAKTHTKDRRFKCHVCGFAFTEQFNLRSHIKRHIGAKPFACTQCEKKFITKNELKAHVRIHTGERPYICEVCGNGFVTSGSLNEHRKRHNNYRPHKCTLCEKSFFDTGLLREHMVVHTGERTHFCEVCQSGFTRRKALLQHLKLHSGVKQYKCTYCDKAFAQKPGLASHLKTHTKVHVMDKSQEAIEVSY